MKLDNVDATRWEDIFKVPKGMTYFEWLESHLAEGDTDTNKREEK